MSHTKQRSEEYTIRPFVVACTVTKLGTLSRTSRLHPAMFGTRPADIAPSSWPYYRGFVLVERHWHKEGATHHALQHGSKLSCVHEGDERQTRCPWLLSLSSPLHAPLFGCFALQALLGLPKRQIAVGTAAVVEDKRRQIMTHTTTGMGGDTKKATRTAVLYFAFVQKSYNKSCMFCSLVHSCQTYPAHGRKQSVECLYLESKKKASHLKPPTAPHNRTVCDRRRQRIDHCTHGCTGRQEPCQGGRPPSPTFYDSCSIGEQSTIYALRLYVKSMICMIHVCMKWSMQEQIGRASFGRAAINARLLYLVLVKCCADRLRDRVQYVGFSTFLNVLFCIATRFWFHRLSRRYDASDEGRDRP